MHVEAYRLSGAVVNASNWGATGPGFDTHRGHILHIIILSLYLKLVQIHKSFVSRYVFTIFKLKFYE